MQESFIRRRAVFVTLILVNICGWFGTAWYLGADRDATIEWSLAPYRGTSTDRLTCTLDRPFWTDTEFEARRADDAEHFRAAEAGGSPFQLEPAVAGEWRWHSPHAIAFHPDEAFPAGRIFRVSPTPIFSQRTGSQPTPAEAVEWRTGALEWERAVLETIDGDTIAIRLRFNQPVSPRALREAITISVRGDELPVQPVGDAAAPELIVEVPRREVDAVSVFLEAGLSAVGGELPLPADQVRRVALPPAFTYLRADVSRGSRWSGPAVRLRFSAALDPSVVSRKLSVSPEVPSLRLSLESRSRTLHLSGDFESGAVYSITLPEDWMSEKGVPLARSRTVTVTIPDRPPSLDFPLSAGLLAPEGNRALELRTVNIPSVEFSVSRVHDNNLVAHLLYQGEGVTSRALGRKTVHLDTAPNEEARVHLDLRELLGDEARGIYSIRARATRPSTRRDRAVVALSDLGLRARLSEKNAIVWVNSILHGEPIPGAEVELRTRNNQVIATARTHADGLAYLDLPASRPDGSPFVAIVRYGNDHGFLRLDRGADSVRGVDLSGAPWPGALEAYLTAERGVARPGESVNFLAVLRTRDGEVPAPFPLEWRLIRPDGREVERAVVSPHQTEQGMFEHRFSLASDLPTGLYEVLLRLPGGGDVLGRTDLLVEYFLPTRLEVTATSPEERSGPETDPAVRVTARALSGGSTEGMAWSAVARYEPREFRSEEFSDYRFRLEGKRGSVRTQVGALALDESGAGESKIPVPLEVQTKGGEWNVITVASVTEPGSRSVSATARSRFLANERMLGVKTPTGPIHPGEPITLSTVLCSGDDQAVPGRATFEMLRVDRKWRLRQTDQGVVWQSDKQEKPVESGSLRFSSDQPKATIEVTLPEYGHYAIRVTDAETKQVTRVEFGCWGGRPAPPSRPRDEQLGLSLPEKVQPGETIDVRLDAPFDGRLWVTLESDRVLHSEVHEAIASDGEFSVTIPENARGTLFLAVTMIRALDPSARDWRSHRAFGIARVPLPKERGRLPLAIAALDDRGEEGPPPTFRPGTTQRLVVTTSAPDPGEAAAAIQLWGVDTGVLLASGFELADPLDTFLAARRAVIRGLDSYRTLLPDHTPPTELSFIGGDRDRRRRQRTSPVDMTRRPSAVIWAGVQSVDASGRAEFSVVTPEIVGEVTWFALGAEGDRYGLTHAATEISTPIVIENPWPRFVAPGDTFTTPLTISNRTKRDAAILPVLEVDGPLEVTLDFPPEGLRVPAGETVSLSVQAKATGLGPVNIVARAVSAGDSEIDEARVTGEMKVRPVTAFRSTVEMVRAKAGERVEVAAPEDVIADGATMRIAVRPGATVELLPAIAELIEYPYGCVEQTSSRLRALAVALDPAVGFLDSPARKILVERMARSGVLRLERMRGRDGGLGSWPGSSSRPWWSATAYEALRTVAAAGIDVPSETLGELRTYLLRSLDLSGSEAPDANTRVRILRLFAEDREFPRGRFLRWAERLETLDLAARVDIAETWRLLGDRDRALETLAGDLEAMPIETAIGARISTPVAARARLLSTLARIDRDDPRIPVWRDAVIDARQNGSWGNTYENACAIEALLASASPDAADPDFVGTVLVGDAEVPFAPDQPVVLERSGAEAVEVRTTGVGEFSTVVITDGMRTTLPEPYERGLKITRRWTRPDGKEIKPGTTLAVGDLILVEVSIRSTGIGSFANHIALVDALPGGLEPENPRLASSAGKALSPSETPDAAEFLDDRVLIFTSVNSRSKTFRYALRASCVGTFSVPPLEASSMYDPNLAALTAGGTVEIGR